MKKLIIAAIIGMASFGASAESAFICGVAGIIQGDNLEQKANDPTAPSWTAETVRIVETDMYTKLSNGVDSKFLSPVVEEQEAMLVANKGVDMYIRHTVNGKPFINLFKFKDASRKEEEVIQVVLLRECIQTK